jgi:hypothetical protein
MVSPVVSVVADTFIATKLHFFVVDAWTATTDPHQISFLERIERMSLCTPKNSNLPGQVLMVSAIVPFDFRAIAEVHDVLRAQSLAAWN